MGWRVFSIKRAGEDGMAVGEENEREDIDLSFVAELAGHALIRGHKYWPFEYSPLPVFDNGALCDVLQACILQQLPTIR